jgi:glucokinase
LPDFAFPVLVGDIGGTNARFALLEEGAHEPDVMSHEATADHPDIVAAIRAALSKAGGAKPRSALLAVAARVAGPKVTLTNAHWTIEGKAIGEALGLDLVTVVNDYVPVAAGLAHLEAEHLHIVGAAAKAGPGARVVIGPGTGFGAAALVPYEEILAIVSTEAGHVELGPVGADELRLWPLLETAGGRHTVESLLSGPGMTRLYAGLARLHHGARADEHPAPQDVTAHGLSGEDPIAREALALFARLLGRVAGDCALAYLATGGVYIGGGIAPRILPVLDEGGFRAAFEDKAPFAAELRGVPTAVMTAKDPALIGLAALARGTKRFLYHAQVWKA